MHLFAAAGGEADGGTYVVGLQFEVLLHGMVVCPHLVEGERLVEDDDKVVAEVLGHASAVACGVAHDFVLFGDYLDVRATVEGIHHHVCLVGFGEGEAEVGATFRGGDFGREVIFGQVDAVVVGHRLLCLVREPRGALVLVYLQSAGHGHEGELSVVINPGAGLVGLLEASDFVRGIGVRPSIAHLSGLGHPEVHAPGQGDGGIGVSVGKRYLGVGAHQGVDVVHRLLLLRMADDGSGGDGKCENYFLVIHGIEELMIYLFIGT